MRPTETIAKLASFEHRGAGTDAERRAAGWLTSEVDTKAREARTEPFWCRPNWALTHAWHAGLGVAGSLTTEADARVGGALIVLALVSLIADAFTGVSLGRRLTPEHASQNVVSGGPHGGAVHLIVTANYDAGRGGLVTRGRLRAMATAASRSLDGWTPGWLAWLAIALIWVLVTAIFRLEGHRGAVVGVAQLIPTLGLLVAFLLLVEHGTSDFGSEATDNASGAAAAIALVKALDAAPPRHLMVDLVLQGAGDGDGIGLRQYLRSRRGELRAPTTVVLGIAPCAEGSPVWLRSDGAFVPLSYFRELRRMCEAVAEEDPGLEAHPVRGRGSTPALPARERRLPAIAVGASGAGDPAVDLVVEFGLLLVERIDTYVGGRSATLEATPA